MAKITRRGLEIDQDIQRTFRFGKFYAEVKSHLRVRVGALSEETENHVQVEEETKCLESSATEVIEVPSEETSPKVKVSR